jgi:hypothetical protein
LIVGLQPTFNPPELRVGNSHSLADLFQRVLTMLPPLPQEVRAVKCLLWPWIDSGFRHVRMMHKGI